MEHGDRAEGGGLKGFGVPDRLDAIDRYRTRKAFGFHGDTSSQVVLREVLKRAGVAVSDFRAGSPESQAAMRWMDALVAAVPFPVDERSWYRWGQGDLTIAASSSELKDGARWAAQLVVHDHPEGGERLARRMLPGRSEAPAVVLAALGRRVLAATVSVDDTPPGDKTQQPAERPARRHEPMPVWATDLDWDELPDKH